LTVPAAVGRLGTSFVHVHGAAVKLRTVEVRDGVLGRFGIAHFYEREAARLTRFAVGHDVHALYVAISSERILEIG
jgi:hypothetical protein